MIKVRSGSRFPRQVEIALHRGNVTQREGGGGRERKKKEKERPVRDSVTEKRMRRARAPDTESLTFRTPELGWEGEGGGASTGVLDSSFFHLSCFDPARRALEFQPAKNSVALLHPRRRRAHNVTPPPSPTPSGPLRRIGATLSARRGGSFVRFALRFARNGATGCQAPKGPLACRILTLRNGPRGSGKRRRSFRFRSTRRENTRRRPAIVFLSLSSSPRSPPNLSSVVDAGRMTRGGGIAHHRVANRVIIAR